MTVSSARSFIRASWAATVRHHPDSVDDLIGMPHPYTVPSVSGAFQELYYWDTYFANEGLIRDGRLEQAIDNTEDIAALVERYGHMPNGNRTWFENRSQPPYLAMMVERIDRETRDPSWVRRLARPLQREYRFWTTRRSTPCGLSRYSHDGTLADRLGMVATAGERLGATFSARRASESVDELAIVGSHHLAEAESGWDFTPRFDARCEDFCPIDLNANLFHYETTLADIATRLDDPDACAAWRIRAQRRQELIRRHCHDPHTGLYHDYDFANDRRSPVLSAAVFSLLYANVLTRSEGVTLARAALPRLEHAHGIVASEHASADYPYQWSYPNTWAPLVFITAIGLENYGEKAAARRIAAKFVHVVARNFSTTGNLWEKYNGVDGTISDDGEYPAPSMMGWTAGVFVWASDFLGLGGP